MSATTELYGRRHEPSVRLMAIAALYEMGGTAPGRASVQRHIFQEFHSNPPSSTFSTSMKQIEEDGITQEIWDSGKVAEVRLVVLTDEEMTAVKSFLGARYVPIVLPKPTRESSRAPKDIAAKKAAREHVKKIQTINAAFGTNDDLLLDEEFTGQEQEELDIIANRIVKRLIFNKLRRMEEQLNG